MSRFSLRYYTRNAWNQISQPIDIGAILDIEGWNAQARSPGRIDGRSFVPPHNISRRSI